VTSFVLVAGALAVTAGAITALRVGRSNQSFVFAVLIIGLALCPAEARREALAGRAGHLPLGDR
jgi:hypothetical protein